VVDGHEYPADAQYRRIWVYSTTPPPDHDGWVPYRDGRWRREVTQGQVTRLVEVRARATFESLPVRVQSIDPTTGMVAIIAAPGGGGASFQLAHPPHSELSPIHDNAASIEGWYGEVEPHRLTDVRSSTEELDVSLYGIPRPA
jgi:hypothetical protein